MGPRREASQAPRGRSVPGSEGVFNQQEKEQQGLIRALTGTLHHFFGGFSPSVPPMSPTPEILSRLFVHLQALPSLGA